MIIVLVTIIYIYIIYLTMRIEQQQILLVSRPNKEVELKLSWLAYYTS